MFVDSAESPFQIARRCCNVPKAPRVLHMRYGRVWVFALTLLVCLGVSLPHFLKSTPANVPANAAWTVGYWYWQSSALIKPFSSRATADVDVLYVQVGSVPARRADEPWKIHNAGWPAGIPNARRHVAVYRIDTTRPLDANLARQIAESWKSVRTLAEDAGIAMASIQIDYDCPTEMLGSFARFLSLIRKDLPERTSVSITALPDWFRRGTAVADVIAEADEFVPQFYDLQTHGPNDPQIAAAVSASRWKAAFDAFGVPYKIGISTFGRIFKVGSDNRRSYVPDIGPWQIAKLSAETTHTRLESLELFVRIRTGADDTFEMTLPTAESVRQAYEAVLQFRGGWASGVVFFRWPMENETLNLSPDEVRDVLQADASGRSAGLDVRSGDCTGFYCADIWIQPEERFETTPSVLRVGSSEVVEYFLPGDAANVFAEEGDLLRVEIPPFLGLPRVYVGRVFTVKPADFRLRNKS